MTGWLLDNLPWWIWALAALAALGATYSLWRPFWALLPTPLKTAAIAGLAGSLAYLAGRNKGSAGALQRAQEKEQARADDILKKGTEARSRVDRDAVDPRLHDDGWRRKDG